MTSKIKIAQKGDIRVLRSPEYNYNFNTATGQFARWGKTFDHDPVMAPFPEILDLEITTICKGPANKLCPFCYKGSSAHRGENMSLDTFKAIIDKMPWLTQTALGADAHGTTNPDMFPMMEYARSKGIVPNLTIADVSDEVADKLAAVAGAVAVSVYKHAGVDVAYDSIKRLTDRGMTQVNIHIMLSAETYDHVIRVIKDSKTDPRLEKLNAIVILGLKTKNRGKKFNGVSREQYKELVNLCLENEVPFGFDSCSAPAFIDAVEGHEKFEQFKMMAEDCESTLFSSYIGVDGKFYPCSFTEHEQGWEQGIDVLTAKDFIKDVWMHPRTVEFRSALIGNKDKNGCRNCPVHCVNGVDMRVGEFNPKVGDII